MPTLPALPFRGLYRRITGQTRRIWVGNGRAHIEHRPAAPDARDALSRQVVAALEGRDGVRSAAVNPFVQRVVVAFDDAAVSVDDLVEVVERVEAAVGLAHVPFPPERPDHPGDVEPLLREVVQLLSNVVGLGGTVYGRVRALVPGPVPHDLSWPITIAENVPQVRETIERNLGSRATDLALGVSNSLLRGVTLGVTGQVVDVAHRVTRVREITATRRTWADREPQLAPVRLGRMRHRRPRGHRRCPARALRQRHVPGQGACRRGRVESGTPDLLAPLRQALSDDAIDVHYQPIVDLQTGAVHGVEALARWTPDRTDVPPGVFVGLAETQRLIHRLGRLVLDKALAQVASWRSAGHVLHLSVNLSPHQLADPQLAATVAALLRRHDVPPSQLTLELTENILSIDDTTVETPVASLHDLGVELSVDDFGMGTSGLYRLSRLPVDEVKVDRSFVGRMLTHAPVRRIVEAGRRQDALWPGRGDRPATPTHPRQTHAEVAGGGIGRVGRVDDVAGARTAGPGSTAS